MPEYSLKIKQDDLGKRLDLVLKYFSESRNLGLSRTHIQKLITSGNVRLDGEKGLKANFKVREGQVIKIITEEGRSGAPAAQEIPLDIVYQDEDIAVINKQPGLVVHPAPGNYEHTLVNSLLYHFKELSDINPQRPGIVHRLDKDTSGLLVIAKNNPAHLSLAGQFAKHTIKRKYIALVKGRVEFDEDVIELPIGRHPLQRKNMSVGFGPKTKYARTRYRTLKRTKDFSLLELEPFTGRTHQLRVHLSYLGHPILGDVKYGRNNEFVRLALHAQSLGFMHPTRNEFVEFSSPLPKEFSELLKIK
ncbi:MAG: RluA family pseudouridine synthase [Candidatus Omnitrophica bacterium]|nr:RluA family pseudouridine synthase [Candidatus Omnitrophota bacterium]